MSKSSFPNELDYTLLQVQPEKHILVRKCLHVFVQIQNRCGEKRDHLIIFSEIDPPFSFPKINYSK